MAAPPSARSSSTEPATGPPCPGAALGRLEDPHSVAPDGSGKHLSRRVRDEVRANEPAAAGRTIPRASSSRCQRQAIGHTDSTMIASAAGAGVTEDVQHLPEVDLPDDVRGAEAGDDERRRDAERGLLHSDNLGIGRREAYALGCTIRPAVSLLARLGRREHRFAVGQKANAGRVGGRRGRRRRSETGSPRAPASARE